MHWMVFYPSDSDPGLKQFLVDMARYRLLTKQEERAYLTLYQQGNVKAGQKLCQHNLRIVYGIAVGFKGRGVPVLDLVNEGSMGLLKAAARFDLTLDLKFISYAVWWIRQAITKAIADSGRVVRLSGNHEAAIRKARRAPLRQIIGGTYLEETDPDNGRLSTRFQRANQAARMPPISLDHALEEGEDPPIQYLASDAPAADEEAMTRQRLEMLKRLVGKLEAREKQVITLRYGLGDRPPMLLWEIGELLSLSRERVRQIEKDGMAVMRKWAAKLPE